MAKQHRWERGENNVLTCKHCGTQKRRGERSYYGYREFIYTYPDGTTGSDCRACDRRFENKQGEQEMKLLEVIEKAREQGIMPDLKDGVFLAFANYGDVRMYNSNNTYRGLFKLERVNGELEPKLTSGVAKYADNTYAISSGNQYINFIETYDDTRDKTVRTKIGEKLVQEPHEVSYTDTEGKVITVKENINKVVNVYDEKIEKENIKRFKFLDK